MDTSSLYLSTSLCVTTDLLILKLLLIMSAINTDSACPVPPADLIGPANEMATHSVPLVFFNSEAETTPSRGATKIPSVNTAKPAQTP